MGCPMWAKSDEGDGGSMSPFFIPAPMAAFGMIIAFMFGALIGAGMVKKRMMMARMYGGGMHEGGMHGGSWKQGKMMHHHHHGWGMPSCREQHEAWPEKSAEDQPTGLGEMPE